LKLLFLNYSKARSTYRAISFYPSLKFSYSKRGLNTIKTQKYAKPIVTIVTTTVATVATKIKNK